MDCKTHYNEELIIIIIMMFTNKFPSHFCTKHTKPSNKFHIPNNCILQILFNNLNFP